MRLVYRNEVAPVQATCSQCGWDGEPVASITPDGDGSWDCPNGHAEVTGGLYDDD